MFRRPPNPGPDGSGNPGFPPRPSSKPTVWTTVQTVGLDGAGGPVRPVRPVQTGGVGRARPTPWNPRKVRVPRFLGIPEKSKKCTFRGIFRREIELAFLTIPGPRWVALVCPQTGKLAFWRGSDGSDGWVGKPWFPDFPGPGKPWFPGSRVARFPPTGHEYPWRPGRPFRPFPWTVDSELPKVDFSDLEPTQV